MNDQPCLFIGGKEVISENEIQEMLSKLYNDPMTGENAGRDQFYARVKSLYVGISRSDVEKIVANDLVHQLLHRVTPKMKVI